MTLSVSPPRPPRPPPSTFPSLAPQALAQIATEAPMQHFRADLNPTSVSLAPLPGTSVVAPCTAPPPRIVLQVVIEPLRIANL